MKTFKIFEHTDLGREAVKVGFSWPAFFFGIVWMLVKKLWKYAALWFVIYVFMAIIENLLKSGDVATGMTATYDLMIMLGYLLIMLIPAFKGNIWRENLLQDKGYILKTKVEASSLAKALSII
ncbi:MAG: DUF2628 domain-containing protein, partial [Desulfonatronovibrio sp.]